MIDPRIITGAGVAVIFTFFAARRVGLFLRRRQTWKWDRTKGEIIWSVLQTRDDFWTRLWYRRSRFVPQIRFRYTIGQRMRESDRAVLGVLSPKHETAAWMWIDRFPPGKEVFVYVNPQHPDEAVLVQGDPDAFDSFLHLTLFAVAAGVIVWATPFAVLTE